MKDLPSLQKLQYGQIPKQCSGPRPGRELGQNFQPQAAFG
jgi:hypothetical protein